jgi:hypothetical protein
MSAPLALTLFHALCDVGNALEYLRGTYQPMTDEWLWHTEVLGMLDAAVDMLVESQGLGGADDA